MVVFKQAPFASVVGGNLSQIKKLVIQNFPLTEDETEAHICHENLADMIEIGDADVGMSEALRIMAKVLKAVEVSERAL
tara:strand:- start:654 stop:890 length:237 start_codon:yes stop_codon:yes gene_type:complete